MDVPDLVVEWALGIVTSAGMGSFFFLKSKSSKNTASIVALKEQMDQKIVDAIEKLGENVTPLSLCNAKQELWQTRFDMWMTQNKEQHDHIDSGVAAALENIEKQLVFVFEKLDSLSKGDK